MGTRRPIAGSLRMRVLFALPLLLLAACGDKEEQRKSGISTDIVEGTEPDAVRNATPPPEAPPLPQAEAPHPDLRGGTPTGAIPAALQGRWTGLADRCGDRSAELELTVTPKSLVFHESVGTVNGVVSGANGRLRVDAAFTGEGDSWTKTLEMRPSANGRELTVINDGTAVTRKRC